eukprot:XP_011674129.1 PREDICTED: cell wall protein DAN4 isoform X1 [Strongylocentrotus purpuratus]
MISKRKGILLSRKTDYLTNSNKAGAWEALVEAFHAKFGRRWSCTQIKDQWKRIRINAKKEYSNYTRESRKTGGGPPPPEPSNLTIIVKELCPYDFVQLRNRFDDDNNQDQENIIAINSLTSIATGRNESRSTPTNTGLSTGSFLEPRTTSSEVMFEGLASQPSTSTATPRSLSRTTSSEVMSEGLASQPSTSTATPRSLSRTTSSEVMSEGLASQPSTSTATPRSLSRTTSSEVMSEGLASQPSTSTATPRSLSRTTSSEVMSEGLASQPSTSTATPRSLSSNTEINTALLRTPAAKRALSYNSQNKKCRLAEDRMVELAEEEHAVRLDILWKEHNLKIKEHELRMEIIKIEKQVAEAKLLEAQGNTSHLTN